MANKNTNMILAVAVIAVCAIAIIGVGYAYTATTENTANTSTVKYITLDQGNNANNYKEQFNASITYNTKNTGPNTTEFTLNDEVDIVGTGTTAVKGVLVGTTTINVVKSTDNSDQYVFSVEKTDGDMNKEKSSPEVVIGEFYIGIKFSDNGTETIRLFDDAKKNYYSTKEGTAAVVPETGKTPVESGAAVINESTIIVNLYYAPNLPTNTTPPTELKPLDDVTFTFTAEAPAVAPTTP